MDEFIKGAGVRVEIGVTEDTAKDVTEVTEADPGVASSTSHGLQNGSVGYFSAATGMPELQGQVFRVSDTATGTFKTEGVDTTGYGNFTAGKVVPITAWATLSQSTEYQIGGGDGAVEDTSVLLDTRDKNTKVTLGAETVTINVRAVAVDNAALTKIRAVARKLGYLVFRITLSNGSQRLFRGQPSLPGENLANKGTGTGSLNVTVIGNVLYLGPVAP